MTSGIRQWLFGKSAGCVLFIVFVHAGVVLSTSGAPRGFTVGDAVQPLNAQQDAKLDPSMAAGIFVGVNEFKDKRLSSLEYAADDAVDMAYLFSEKLKLISPSNVWLAIAGQVKKDSTKATLAELRRDGANQAEPRYTDFLGLLTEVPPITRSQGLLVIQISSHGFDDHQTPYVMLHDSLIANLQRTGIPLTTIEEAMSTDPGSPNAARRLLLIDACRSKALEPPKSARSGLSQPYPAPEMFTKSFLEAKGQATLSAADKNYYSYEDGSFQQGVFTHFVIEGLTGKVRGDASGLIRIGDLANWVGQQVNSWSKQTKKEQEQVIHVSFGQDAQAIPLAYDATKDLQEVMQRKANAKKLLFAAMQANLDLITGKMFDDIKEKLNTLEGEKLNKLLAQLEALKNPDAIYVQNFVDWWQRFSPGGLIAEPLVIQAPQKPDANPPQKNIEASERYKNMSLVELNAKQLELFGKENDLEEKIKDTDAKIDLHKRLSSDSSEVDPLVSQKTELKKKLADLRKELKEVTAALDAKNPSDQQPVKFRIDQ